MKYCFSCRRVTGGKPFFCNHCGRSYESKFCSRLHKNPRSAQACSQCGSRDLSMPQAYLSWWRKARIMVSTIFGYILLLMTSAYAVFFVYRLIVSPNTLLRPMILGLLISLLWLIYFALTSK